MVRGKLRYSRDARRIAEVVATHRLASSWRCLLVWLHHRRNGEVAVRSLAKATIPTVVGRRYYRAGTRSRSWRVHRLIHSRGGSRRCADSRDRPAPAGCCDLLSQLISADGCRSCRQSVYSSMDGYMLVGNLGFCFHLSGDFFLVFVGGLLRLLDFWEKNVEENIVLKI